MSLATEETNHTHHFIVKREFARQSESMQEARIFTGKEIIDKISSAILKAGRRIRVLDLGCGPDILTTALAPYVTEVVALDITPKMIERIRQRSIELGLNNVRLRLGESA